MTSAIRRERRSTRPTLLRRARPDDWRQRSVRLEGLRYHVTLDLPGPTVAPDGRSASSRSTASPGRSLPPFEMRGAGGWVSGYVVPVMSGALTRLGSIAGGDAVDAARHRLPRSQLGLLGGRVVAVGPGAARRAVVRLRPRVFRRATRPIRSACRDFSSRSARTARSATPPTSPSTKPTPPPPAAPRASSSRARARPESDDGPSTWRAPSSARGGAVSAGPDFLQLRAHLSRERTGRRSRPSTSPRLAPPRPFAISPEASRPARRAVGPTRRRPATRPDRAAAAR